MAETKKEAADQVETGFNGDHETVPFIDVESHGKSAAGEAKNMEEQDDEAEFYGLTREELDKFADDPKWIKIRRVLFVIFVIGWAGILVAAVVIVVVAPGCPPIQDLVWYQEGVMYKVNPKNFQDSNGTAEGDLKGELSSNPSLDHG